MNILEYDCHELQRGRSFFALEHVKNILKSTLHQDKMKALALLLIIASL